MWQEIDLIASRYGWSLTEIKGLAFSRYARALKAAQQGALDDGRERMIANLLPYWLEHVDGRKMPFDRFCEKLGLIEVKSEPATVRKLKAAAAIERAEAIRKADKGGSA